MIDLARQEERLQELHAWRASLEYRQRHPSTTAAQKAEIQIEIVRATRAIEDLILLDAPSPIIV